MTLATTKPGGVATVVAMVVKDAWWPSVSNETVSEINQSLMTMDGD